MLAACTLLQLLICCLCVSGTACFLLVPAQVPVRIQPTHLLCRRWPTPAGAPPDKKKKPQHSGSESGEEEDYSDAGEDEQQAAAATPKKSNAVTGRCSKAGMQQHKAALAAAAAAADEDGDEDGQREVIINPAHLDAVATAAQASDGQFGYEHLEEPLSLFDFHRCAVVFDQPSPVSAHTGAPACTSNAVVLTNGGMRGLTCMRG
jgi:hypothetical protein